MIRISARAFLRYWLPVLVMVGIIALESTDYFSSTNTGEMLDHLLGWLRLSEDQLATVNHVLRKSGHCVGYGFLSFVIFRAFRGTHRFVNQGYDGWISSRVSPQLGAAAFSTLWHITWAFWALAGTALVAACDEMHQMTLPSRTGTWWDVLLDTSAAFVVQVLIYLTDRAIASRMARVS